MKKIGFVGKMDRRVEIFQKVISRSANGESIETLQSYRKAWAKADDQSGNEQEDGKIYLYQIRKYLVRYDQQLALEGEKMMIRDYDGDYHITSIEHLGRKQFLILKTLKRE